MALLVSGEQTGATALAGQVAAASTWTPPSRPDAAAPVYASPGTAAAPFLQEQLQAPDPHWDYTWGRHWLRTFVADLSETVPDGTDPFDVLQEIGKSRTGLFVVDGLEAFIGTASDDAVQTMIRVLLLDTADHLRSIPDRPFGLLVFVRRETVRWAVQQNSAQLLNRYCDYDLD